MVSDVFGYCPLFLRELTVGAGFGICGPGITTDESVAVPADEDVGNGS